MSRRSAASGGLLHEALEALQGGLLSLPGNSRLREHLEQGQLRPNQLREQLRWWLLRVLTLRALPERSGAVLGRPVPGEPWWLTEPDWRRWDEALRRLERPAPAGPQSPLLWSQRACWALEDTALPRGLLREVMSRLEPCVPRDGPSWSRLTRSYQLALEHAASQQSTPADGSSEHRRRQWGSYYTPAAVIQLLLSVCLEPLRALAASRPIRLLDPSCGAGDFLLASLSWLRTAGGDPAEVCRRQLHGVDRDPFAVALTRVGLWLQVGDWERSPEEIAPGILWGDSLLGELSAGRGSPLDQREADRRQEVLAGGPLERAREEGGPGLLHPWLQWPEVHGDGGFDAVLGNPPWIAHAGRAAQPLSTERRRLYRAAHPAFRGYPSTHGLFVARSAQLLRPGGRLGLVLPCSVADLKGYAPCRAEHDRYCRAQEPLTQLGEGVFQGVNTPCMILHSVRAASEREPPGACWRLQREDLQPWELALMDRLQQGPRLPAACFGERGHQTRHPDEILKASEPRAPFTQALRSGRDLRPWRLLPPSQHIQPGDLQRPERFQEAELLLRQTARYPIAARSDGLPFRNSLLAGFSQPELSASELLGLLNSSLLRWLHYQQHRDARQGMPQVKIHHLRSLPFPLRWREADRRQLSSLAESAEQDGDSSESRRALDRCVAALYKLSSAERSGLELWWCGRSLY